MISEKLQKEIDAVNALDLEDKNVDIVHQRVIDKRQDIFNRIYNDIYLRLTRGKGHRSFRSIYFNDSADQWEDMLCSEFSMLNELLGYDDDERQFETMLREKGVKI